MNETSLSAQVYQFSFIKLVIEVLVQAARAPADVDTSFVSRALGVAAVGGVRLSLAHLLQVLRVIPVLHGNQRTERREK